MLKKFQILFLALFLAVPAVSCGGNDFAETAAKVQNNDQLSDRDYQIMIEYIGEAYQYALPKIKEAQTFEDLANIDDELLEKYEYTDLFNTALLHDYPMLSASQKEKMESLQKELTDAYTQ